MTTHQTLQPTSGVYIQIDPEALLQAFVPEGYDHERDEEYGGPVVSRLLAGATTLLADRFAPIIEAEIRAAVQDQIGARVAEVFEQGIRRTDHWGQPTGEPTTVAAMIRAEAEKYLTDQVGDYNRRETRAQKLVREAVDARFGTELRKAVDHAKGEALAKVRTAASEIVTETIARAAGVAR